MLEGESGDMLEGESGDDMYKITKAFILNSLNFTKNFFESYQCIRINSQMSFTTIFI